MAGSSARDGGVDALPDPPDAPRIERRLSLYRWQALGMLLIALIPLADIAGLLGESTSRIDARAGALSITATVPAVFRYKTTSSISLFIRNDGVTPIDSVHVLLDTAYLARFSTISAVPQFAEAYNTMVGPITAGGTALVAIDIQAERYGRHTGVALIHAGSDSARITFATTVLP